MPPEQPIYPVTPPQNPLPAPKTSNKLLWGLVLVLLIVGGASVYGFYFYKPAENTQLVLNTATSTLQTYRNNEYEFEIKLNEDWKNYKVVKSGNNYFFCLPTITQGFPDSKCNSDSQSHFAPVFFLTIFTPDEWRADQAQEAYRSTYVSQSEKYIVGYGMAQDSPPDLWKQYLETRKVISTFKFTK